MKYEHIVAEVFRRPWAILPEKLKAIVGFIAFAAAGGRLSKEQVEAIQAGPRPRANTPGTVALIPVFGVIAHRMSAFSEISGPGGTSIQKLTETFRKAMEDPGVKAIVFEIDSPGGTVDGVPELAQEIYDGRSKKKIVAHVNTMAASAAYWLAASADEIVVTPSGEVGSIGVFAAHEDFSKALEQEGIKVSLVSAGKYKTENNPYEPLSEEGRASIQAAVDAFYGMFIKAVAKGRGSTPAVVREGFGQGRMVLAQDAITAGMADKIATLDETLARFGVGTASSAKPMSSKSMDMLSRELALYE